MKYSEKVLNDINNMCKRGEIPNITKNGKDVTVEYNKVYKQKESKLSTTFCYKISNEAKPLFGMANKTYVVINHDSPIDYMYYHKEFIPKEIVAVACGFEDYKDLKDKESKLPSDEKDRIEFMIHGLIPISQEEYENI